MKKVGTPGDRLKVHSQVSALMETSDDNLSHSAMYPVGILDQQISPTEPDDKNSATPEVDKEEEEDNYGHALIGINTDDKTSLSTNLKQ